MKRWILLTTLVIFASACGPIQDRPPRFVRNVHRIPDAVPKQESLSRIGNRPYTVFGQRYTPMQSAKGYKEVGTASWYGMKFHGRETSSGERYDVFGMTAAHKTLPLPTYVRVTNCKNHRSIIVKVNDRGPFHQDRIIDLSYAAAQKLYIDGTEKVLVEALDPNDPSFQRNRAPIKPPSILPSLTSYYVQLGVFSSRTNAEKIVQSIPEGTPVRIKQQDSRYRVLAGPFKTRRDASQLNEKLVSVGFENAQIVTR